MPALLDILIYTCTLTYLEPSTCMSDHTTYTYLHIYKLVYISSCHTQHGELIIRNKKQTNGYKHNNSPISAGNSSQNNVICNDYTCLIWTWKESGKIGCELPLAQWVIIPPSKPRRLTHYKIGNRWHVNTVNHISV